MDKKDLLSQIINDEALRIEKVFGESAWAVFKELQQDDRIVVVGNGPVDPSSTHGKFIESAKLIIRCNNYLANVQSDLDQRKRGRRCDVQFICLHGGEFRKAGLQFLYDWCPESKVVLALENTNAREKISKAIVEERGRSPGANPILAKILWPKDAELELIFAIDCTRGFYAVAFALQAMTRLQLTNPVSCIGFGRSGHENYPYWRIHHDHEQEKVILFDMFKEQTKLVHLEWEDSSEEILASLKPKKFLQSSIRIVADVAPAAIQEVVEGGLDNVADIMKMACKSKYYKHIPIDRIQEMATHGLIIHPEHPEYLTCDHHLKRGKHVLWPDAKILEQHFDAKHKENYAAWRQGTAAKRMPSQEIEDEAAKRIPSSPSGVWREPLEYLKKPAAPPVSSTAAASSGASWTAPKGPYNIFQAHTELEEEEEERIKPDVECVDQILTEWMIAYAHFQYSAQVLHDYADDEGPHGPYAQRKKWTDCFCYWKALEHHTEPGLLNDLQYYKTTSGASWDEAAGCLEIYLETEGDQSLLLRGSAIKFTTLLGIVCNMVKQVLTWRLVNGYRHECIQALVAFNRQCLDLGAKAICYLSHDTTGAADGVTISLTGADPRMKYTGSHKGTKRQLAEGVLGSQARRSTDIGTIVPRTQTKRALK